MKKKVWSEKQLPIIQKMETNGEIPVEVVSEVRRVLCILDQYYGAHRDVDNDDGGYVLIFTDCLEDAGDIQKILDRYHVLVDEAELYDTLCDDGSVAWVSTLFLITNDFGITIIYPTEANRK